MHALIETIDNALWRPGLSRRPFLVRLGWTALRQAYALGRDLLGGELTLRAMSLVYITLLSTVPLLAFSFSLIKVFGVHNRLKARLYLLTDPLGPQGAEITDWVIGTIDRLQGGLLGALSLVFFLYTAVAVIQRIESIFNFIWQVGQPRHLGRRLTEYTTVILIGPVVMTLSLALIAAIRNSAVARVLGAVEPFGSTLVAAGRLLPYVLVIGVFSLLYKYLPNTRVRLRAALTGGVVAGTLWAFTGSVFAGLVALSVTRNAIYGTFAIAISGLIWVYLSWLILLVGAQLAFYVQNPIFMRLGRRRPHLSNALRERIALNLMYLVAAAFRQRGASCTLGSMAEELNIPELTLQPVLAALEGAGLVAPREDDSFVPGREIARITLADILAAVRAGGETGAMLPPVWSPAVAEVAGRLESTLAAEAAATTLSELLDRGPPT